MDAILKVLRGAGATLAAALLMAAPAGAQTRAVQAGELRFEALAPQELEAGRCGLFIWARGEDPVFILMALDEPAEARVRTEGRNRSLARTEFSGRPAFGHFENETYSDGRVSLSLDMHFDLERPLRAGTVVDHGVARVTDREGWVTVLPIGGMIACQS
jgi:hypothetical protein